MHTRQFRTIEKCIVIFLVLLVYHPSDCVIYRLNETEYLKMPPIYHLDHYDSCILQPNGTYCYVDMELVSDGPSELLQMIHEYSEHTSIHFNHTRLHHGICLSKTCKHILQDIKAAGPKWILERCLNETLWRDYQLKAKLLNKISCTKLDEPMVINMGDICAAMFFVCLMLLNVIGSLYDVCIIKGGQGHRFLLSFSLKRNFKKLTTSKIVEPHQDRLRGIYGVKTLTIILVIFAHSPTPLVISSENPHVIEQTYYNILSQPYFNGTLIVQTLFIITGCLMAYKYRVYIESNKKSWVFIPKEIFMRWIRLTPAYAVVLIFTSTWMRFIASGPLWETTVGVEVADCRRDGWWNMIFLNNYIDNSQCMVQTWFLAANLHLYIIGLLVCFFANTSKKRTLLLSALFIVGFIIPSIHTYLQDLDANVLMAPESARNFFITDPTFNHSYKRSHTNLPGFVLGLAVGNIIYGGLRDEIQIKKYKKLGYLYYITVPVGVALLLSGIVFYGDRPRLPLYLRTILSALLRPLFALIMAVFLVGMVFKFENLYRRTLEWRAWRTPAEVSYSAYLMHVAIIRIYAGMNTTLLRSGIAQVVKEASGIIFMSFLIAYPFWLFVEAPLNRAILSTLRLSNQQDANQIMGRSHKLMEQVTTIIGSESKESMVVDIRL